MSFASLNAIRRATALLVAICASLGLAAGAQATVGDLVVVVNTGVHDEGEVREIDLRPAISADGRFVAYVEPSYDLGDLLFLRDVHRGKTTRVVGPSEPGSLPGFETNSPVLSANSRYLAFVSDDPNLSNEDIDSFRGATGLYRVHDIFVYDRGMREMTLVSRRSGPHGEPAGEDSARPSISADGRFVAYVTDSWNLSPPRPPIPGGVFSRDLRTETNRLISGVPGIMFWHPSSFWPSISGDGRRVAFGFQYSTTPYNPEHPPHNVGGWLHRRHKQIMLADPEWKRPRVVSRASGPGGAIANANCSEPTASGSGRFVAFACEANNLVRGDRNKEIDIFVRDVRRDLTVLVSRRGIRGAIGTGESLHPSISANGRYVAFQSESANLLPDDRNGKTDIFVKDLRTGRLILASGDELVGTSNGSSGVPVISANGRYVAFSSNGSNLSPDDPEHDLTYYRYQLLP